MAQTAAKQTAPATPAKPSVFTLDADYLDAITPKGRGRQSTPSVYATDVAKAKRGTWFGINANLNYPGGAEASVKGIVRELRKAEKQHNTANESDPIKVSVRPRTDHPKLGAFVAWMVETAAPTTPPPAASE